MGKLFMELFTVELHMRVVAVSWVLYDIILRVSRNLFVQLAELIKKLFNFFLLLFVLVLLGLDSRFLEHLVIVDDFFNLILLHFDSLEWEARETELIDEQLHSLLDKLAIFWKKLFQPVWVILILLNQFFNGIDSLFENPGFLRGHEVAASVLLQEH